MLSVAAAGGRPEADAQPCRPRAWRLQGTAIDTRLKGPVGVRHCGQRRQAESDRQATHRAPAGHDFEGMAPTRPLKLTHTLQCDVNNIE